jgi:hypothetical protein
MYENCIRKTEQGVRDWIKTSKESRGENSYIVAKGYVHITGLNADVKQYERFFSASARRFLLFLKTLALWKPTTHLWRTIANAHERLGIACDHNRLVDVKASNRANSSLLREIEI